MTNLFLEQEHLEMIRALIKVTYPNAVIYAYGSRVYGNEQTAHSGSDLDLCVKCFGVKNGDIVELRAVFIESNIPFLIDIFEYDKLPKAFQAEIDKKHLVIYEPE